MEDTMETESNIILNSEVSEQKNESTVIDTAILDSEQEANTSKRKPRKKKVDASQDSTSAVEQVDVEQIATSQPEKEDKQITSEPKKQESTPTKLDADAYKTGDVVDANMRFRLYATAVSPAPLQTIKGRFYIWDAKVVCNRIRLTDSPSGVSNPTRVIGWAKVTDLKIASSGGHKHE